MLTRRQLRHYRKMSEEYMMDEVVVLTRSQTTGSYGEPVFSYTTSATYSAGLAFSPFKFRAREISNDTAEAYSEVLVRARLPEAAYGNIQPEDKLVLTKKWNETLESPIEFLVQGFEEHVAHGVIYNLKRLEL